MMLMIMRLMTIMMNLNHRGETSEQESGQEKSKANDRVSFQTISIVMISDCIQYPFLNMNYHQGSIVYQDTGKVSTLPR